ncbi:hypothetical protein B5M09_011084 [Aphanomyces astaci]|uniref:CCHC-type domain-containing protein n=1 Tax=Aphanomyces astaci TaxID=112090 RepID=A0A3R7WQQ3_APHAT|nr:hypothetical protein B5M09_011084 [Aphanomyces astaci]
MSGAGRARVGHTPVLISSKPHEMTISGQTSVAVVLVVVMVLVNALDGLCAATLAARLDTTQGEHATLCHFCGQPGHTVAKCPSKPANEAWGFGAEMNLTGTGFVSACHTQYAPYVRKGADDQPARPVFSDAEVNDLLSSCPEIREEEYPKEIEDRLYPITPANVRMQTDRIRERRKNPAQEEILKTLNLLPSDAYQLLAPADIEDEAKWYARFADTLNKCGEANRANRDFKTFKAVTHIQ